MKNINEIFEELKRQNRGIENLVTVEELGNFFSNIKDLPEIYKEAWLSRYSKEEVPEGGNCRKLVTIFDQFIEELGIKKLIFRTRSAELMRPVINTAADITKQGLYLIKSEKISSSLEVSTGLGKYIRSTYRFLLGREVIKDVGITTPVRGVTYDIVGMTYAHCLSWENVLSRPDLSGDGIGSYSMILNGKLVETRVTSKGKFLSGLLKQEYQRGCTHLRIDDARVEWDFINSFLEAWILKEAWSKLAEEEGIIWNTFKEYFESWEI